MRPVSCFGLLGPTSRPEAGDSPQRVGGRLDGRRAGGVAVLLLVAFVVLHLPFRSRFLVNWDAVNFALGIETFNLSHHQPHPPGYVGYVGLGRLLSWFTGDANEALTLLSVGAGGVLVAVSYLLGRRILSERFALVGALLVGTSPLVWYYSSVALTYVVGAAVAVGVAWAAHAAHTQTSRPHLYAAAGLLALLGALRQTDMALLLPVVVVAARPHPWSVRLRAAGLLGGLSAVWLVPLVWSSGGIGRYVELSQQLADLAGGRTFVLSGDLSGMLQNVGLVVVGVVLGLGVALLAMIPALRHRTLGVGRLGADDRRLLAAWVAPPLLVFLLVHTGQFGYVLLILPPLVLAAASILEETWQDTGEAARRGLLRWSSWAGAGVGAALLGLNLAAGLLVPDAAVAMLQDGGTEEVIDPLVPGGGGVTARTRQFVLADNDAHWRRLVGWVRRFPPEHTVVLATPNSGGSFRHLSYYTPRVRVLGVGDDRDGTFGYLFSAHRRRTRYSIDGLEEARTVLRLPRSVRWVVVPDQAVQSRLPDGAVDRRLRLADGSTAVAIRVPPGATLWFDEEEDLRIRSDRRPARRT